MFTQRELKTLSELVVRHTPHPQDDPKLLKGLEEKLDQAIRDGQGGSAYRSKPTLVETDDDDDGLDWLDDDDELIKQLVITEEQKLVSARGMLRALQQRNDELTAKLAGLENVRAIQRENERLRAELEVKGPPEAHEEIDALKRAAQSAEQDKEVLQRQVDALKTALHSERTQRQCVDAYYQPALTLAEKANVARLTGRCTCLDPSRIDPKCPRHGNGNGALEP
jgi:DNA repair exonuclease SbcCD ATPase subunit